MCGYLWGVVFCVFYDCNKICVLGKVVFYSLLSSCVFVVFCGVCGGYELCVFYDF